MPQFWGHSKRRAQLSVRVWCLHDDENVHPSHAECERVSLLTRRFTQDTEHNWVVRNEKVHIIFVEVTNLLFVLAMLMSSWRRHCLALASVATQVHTSQLCVPCEDNNIVGYATSFLCIRWFAFFPQWTSFVLTAHFFLTLWVTALSFLSKAFHECMDRTLFISLFRPTAMNLSETLCMLIVDTRLWYRVSLCKSHVGLHSDLCLILGSKQTNQQQLLQLYAHLIEVGLQNPGHLILDIPKVPIYVGAHTAIITDIRLWLCKLCTWPGTLSDFWVTVITLSVTVCN